MLCIISRDGKAIHEFCELHNLDHDKIKVIKNASDLDGCDGHSYVVLKPYPNCYQWSIRPLCSILHMKNKTKEFNKKQLSF